MIVYDHVKTICQIIKENIGFRKIVLLCENERKRAEIKRQFSEHGYDINFEICGDDKQVNYKSVFPEQYIEKIRDCAEKYYIVIWEAYSEVINQLLIDNGFIEIKDFIYRSPKAIRLKGNLENYKDDRGNVINKIPANLSIILAGYSSHIEFGQNITLGISSTLTIYSDAFISIEDGSRFVGAASILMENCTKAVIKKSKFGSEFILACLTGSNLECGRCNFGDKNVLSVNQYCTMQLGNEILTARECTIRSGDGHGIWNVLNGQKKNFHGEESITIGDHVWMCQGSKILSSSIIGSGCIIATDAVVKGTFPNNCLLGGIMAHILKTDIAWSPDPLAEDMINSCGNSYAIPTIKLDEIKDSALRLCHEITDIYEYFEQVAQLKNKLLIIAVKDIIGYCITEKLEKSMQKLGLKADFSDKGWHGYITVLADKKVIYEKVGVLNEPLNYEKKLNNLYIQIESMPLHSGNQANITINKYNYAVNSRGFNIVLFDKKSNQLADSVCFDTHVKELTCSRKILTC